MAVVVYWGRVLYELVFLAFGHHENGAKEIFRQNTPTVELKYYIARSPALSDENDTKVHLKQDATMTSTAIRP